MQVSSASYLRSFVRGCATPQRTPFRRNMTSPIVRASSNGDSVKPLRADLGDMSSLLDRVNCFIFDCDGVIWRGDCLIDGVPETLDYLRDLGKKLVFVTNNSTKSRAGYVKKFTNLGLDVTPEEIFSSSFAAAAYLEDIKFDPKKKVKKNKTLMGC